jgi:hypothetical protein
MKKEVEFAEDFKRKNWTPDEWKNSEDEIDRFLYWVNYLSLHNLWKARSVYRSKLDSARQETLEEVRDDIVKIIEDSKATFFVKKGKISKIPTDEALYELKSEICTNVEKYFFSKLEEVKK